MFKFGDKVVANIKSMSQPIVGVVRYIYSDGVEPKYLVACEDGTEFNVATEDLSLYERKPLDMQILHDFYNKEYMRRGICPNCKDERGVTNTYVYCPYCGQKLDWSEEDKNEN